jgi:hypothetical protein
MFCHYGGYDIVLMHIKELPHIKRKYMSVLSLRMQ